MKGMLPMSINIEVMITWNNGYIGWLGDLTYPVIDLFKFIFQADMSEISSNNIVIDLLLF